MKARLHYHRFATDGFIWTLHTTYECIPAKKVIIHGTLETEFKPEKKSNPRACIVMQCDRIETNPTNGTVEVWTR